MWFWWRPFWMCHKTRLRGGKNWTPIFLAYLTPNKVKKTIKSILARTFNFRHISDIPHQTNRLNIYCLLCTRYTSVGILSGSCPQRSLFWRRISSEWDPVDYLLSKRVRERVSLIRQCLHACWSNLSVKNTSDYQKKNYLQGFAGLIRLPDVMCYSCKHA